MRGIQSDQFFVVDSVLRVEVQAGSSVLPIFNTSNLLEIFFAIRENLPDRPLRSQRYFE